jgi:hypothetical protein
MSAAANSMGGPFVSYSDAAGAYYAAAVPSAAGDSHAAHMQQQQQQQAVRSGDAQHLGGFFTGDAFAAHLSTTHHQQHQQQYHEHWQHHPQGGEQQEQQHQHHQQQRKRHQSRRYESHDVHMGGDEAAGDEPNEQSGVQGDDSSSFPPRRKRGRPPGAKNKPKPVTRPEHERPDAWEEDEGVQVGPIPMWDAEKNESLGVSYDSGGDSFSFPFLLSNLPRPPLSFLFSFLLVTYSNLVLSHTPYFPYPFIGFGRAAWKYLP